MTDSIHIRPEPVAWMYEGAEGAWVTLRQTKDGLCGLTETPLYTAPQGWVPDLSVMRCEGCAWAKINWRKGDKYQRDHGAFSAVTTETRPTTSVQCRINPPMKATQENDYDGWPFVDGDDWCGCFKPKMILPPPPTDNGGE